MQILGKIKIRDQFNVDTAEKNEVPLFDIPEVGDVLPITLFNNRTKHTNKPERLIVTKRILLQTETIGECTSFKPKPHFLCILSPEKPEDSIYLPNEVFLYGYICLPQDTMNKWIKDNTYDVKRYTTSMGEKYPLAITPKKEDIIEYNTTYYSVFRIELNENKKTITLDEIVLHDMPPINK